MLDVTYAQQSERVVNDIKPYSLVNNAGVSASGAIEYVGAFDREPSSRARAAHRHRGEGAESPYVVRFDACAIDICSRMLGL